MRKTRTSSNRQVSNNNFNSNISHLIRTSNLPLQHQPNFNQFTITVFKKGNGQYSLENPIITSTLPQQTPKSTLFLFKRKNWVSKLRSQDKGVRNAKNIRNLCKDLIDGISYSVCIEINK